jgi:nucleotide-binding universal stress UspA family protein
MSSNDERPIVVGVDGSDSSKAALAWAVHQAELEHAPLTAVIAWEYPVFYGPVPPMYDNFDFAGNAASILQTAVKDAVGDQISVPIATKVVQDNAAHALIDASRDARLLVVGNRGHGGFVEALLGSVSQHCTHHAVCPVIVIRGTEGDE